MVATIFSSLAFLFLSISMANLSRLVAASLSSLALLSSSVSTANLSCLLMTTFSSLRFLSNSLSSPRFNLLRVARRCFLCFSVFLFSRLILSFSFCFKFKPFLSERFFFVHAKAALAHSRKSITRVSQVGFYRPKLTSSMRVGHIIPPTHFGHDRHTNRHTERHISRKISIEHPSVGLASFAQLQ